MLPVDPDHRQNRRVDGRTDFAALKARGLVRDKEGNEIPIDKPHHTWSALDRDRLYQAYCEFAKACSGERAIRNWIEARAVELRMSPERARDVINEGNGQHAEHNMQWW